jgi:hypothetical protein
MTPHLYLFREMQNCNRSFHNREGTYFLTQTFSSGYFWFFLSLLKIYFFVGANMLTRSTKCPLKQRNIQKKKFGFRFCLKERVINDQVKEKFVFFCFYNFKNMDQEGFRFFCFHDFKNNN